MHKTIAKAFFMSAIAGPVLAQTSVPIPPDPAKCPASGYDKPLIVFGGATGFEVAGPCTPQAVRDAAEAVGLGRRVPIGLKNIVTLRFSGTGTIAGSSGQDIKAAKVLAHINYVIPAMRLEIEGVQSNNAAIKEIQVFAGGAAWNEATPGTGATAVAAGAPSYRAPLIKLTPQGAMWSLVEAEGTVRVSTVGGKTVISGASPYDNIPVTVTLDAESRPEAVVVNVDGRRYEAKFSGYKAEVPPYMSYFPGRMSWSVNGKPVADLQVTEFRTHPFVIFPVPAVARRD